MCKKKFKIISGGQTGVDRAALDAATDCGIPLGGWCPRGRLAEDGAISEKYPLKETTSANYSPRTRKNVEESDGTLILNEGDVLKGGTAYTKDTAVNMAKPFTVINLNDKRKTPKATRWIKSNKIRVLNVAGPRESHFPGIYGKARMFLKEILPKLF